MLLLAHTNCFIFFQRWLILSKLYQQYSNSNMHKLSKNTQSLKLQSYKIDTSQLQSKIHELDQLKSDLKTSIARQREQQETFLNEIHDLRLQNQRLKKSIINLEFTNKSQKMLIEQLEKKLARSQELMSHYQNEAAAETQKRKEVEQEYQMQVAFLLKEQQKLSQQHSSKGIGTFKVVETNEGRSLQSSSHRISEQTITDSQKSSASSKKIKRLKKASSSSELPSGIKNFQPKEKYLIANSIPQKQEDSNISAEDIYLEMIRSLYKQLTKIEIKARDLYKLPILDSFTKVRTPTKKDVYKLLSSHPFQVKEQHKAETIFLFLEKELTKRGKEMSGRDITDIISEAIEELEADRQLSIQIGNSSMYASDSELMSSHLGSSLARRVSKPWAEVAEAQEYSYSRDAIQQCSEPSQFM